MLSVKQASNAIRVDKTIHSFSVILHSQNHLFGVTTHSKSLNHIGSRYYAKIPARTHKQLDYGSAALRSNCHKLSCSTSAASQSQKAINPIRPSGYHEIYPLILATNQIGLTPQLVKYYPLNQASELFHMSNPLSNCPAPLTPSDQATQNDI